MRCWENPPRGPRAVGGRGARGLGHLGPLCAAGELPPARSVGHGARSHQRASCDPQKQSEILSALLH